MTTTISSFTCSTQSQCITIKAYIYIKVLPESSDKTFC